LLYDALLIQKGCVVKKDNLEQSNLSLKKIVFSDEEKIALCKNWQASDLTFSAFCAKHRVSKSSIYKWQKIFFPLCKEQEVPSFIKLQPATQESIEPVKISIELKLNHGLSLNLSLPANHAALLIKELNHATPIIR